MTPIYRWIVLLLAAFYMINNVLLGNWAPFGGPLRFLTIWALCASFLSAAMMLAGSANRLVPQITAVLNLMVVFLYWRLYFDDPANFGSGGDVIWWEEYYLHLLGPLLQVFDALFIAGAFARVRGAVLPLLGVVAGYCLWAELGVQPLNDTPTGRVTSGLPYPFLNNMGLQSRLSFYVIYGVVAMVVLGLLAGVHRLRMRVTGAGTTA